MVKVIPGRILLLSQNHIKRFGLFWCPKHKEEICRQRMIVMSYAEDNAAKIKAGASLLLKGGTLISEACQKCSGAQVRFANQTTCINCGNVQEVVSADSSVEPEKSQSNPGRENLTSAASLIEEKIAMLANEIKNESDISMQRQKANLLETYLRILEKTKSLI